MSIFIYTIYSLTKYGFWSASEVIWEFSDFQPLFITIHAPSPLHQALNPPLNCIHITWILKCIIAFMLYWVICVQIINLFNCCLPISLSCVALFDLLMLMHILYTSTLTHLTKTLLIYYEILFMTRGEYWSVYITGLINGLKNNLENGQLKLLNMWPQHW